MLGHRVMGHVFCWWLCEVMSSHLMTKAWITGHKVSKLSLMKKERNQFNSYYSWHYKICTGLHFEMVHRPVTNANHFVQMTLNDQLSGVTRKILLAIHSEDIKHTIFSPTLSSATVLWWHWRCVDDQCVMGSFHSGRVWLPGRLSLVPSFPLSPWAAARVTTSDCSKRRMQSDCYPVSHVLRVAMWPSQAVWE